jgi:nickel/cobalt exporter
VSGVRALRRGAIVAATIVCALFVATPAHAHPLGNFTINTSAAIVLAPGRARVDYVLDMAEIPTVQAMPELDSNGDGVVADAEASQWARRRAVELTSNIVLALDGDPVPLDVATARVELLPGQGGLRTLRLEAALVGEIGARGELTFVDENLEGRVGWREVTARATDGVTISAATVPSTSVSDHLRAYPRDLLSSPLDVREATITFAPGSGVGSRPIAESGETRTSHRPAIAGGAFADLVARTGGAAALAMVLAFAFGALHALGPGHGKALMATYLVGAGGRARHAVAVGGAVAAMHTASVLALGLAVLVTTEMFAPERVYPWLALASGVVALGLGATLLASRLPHRNSGHHEHGLDHHHNDGGPRRSTASEANVVRSPGPDGAAAAPALSRRGLTALALSGGILPSPTALIVLLGSIALHRAAYGLALIASFSLGLAAALVGVGVVTLRARDLVARRMSSRAARLLPVASASAVAVLGAILTVSGFASL